MLLSDVIRRKKSYSMLNISDDSVGFDFKIKRPFDGLKEFHGYAFQYHPTCFQLSSGTHGFMMTLCVKNLRYWHIIVN